jgi:hypothetical protein
MRWAVPHFVERSCQRAMFPVALAILAVLVLAVLAALAVAYRRTPVREHLTPQDMALMTPAQRAAYDKEADALRNQGRYCRNWKFDPRGNVSCASSSVNGR